MKKLDHFLGASGDQPAATSALREAIPAAVVRRAAARSPIPPAPAPGPLPLRPESATSVPIGDGSVSTKSSPVGQLFGDWNPEEGTATEAPQQTTPTPRGLAKALGAVRVAPGQKLTEEQQAIISAAPCVDVLVIEAGAGTGKTTVLSKLARAMPGRGQYTAFNNKLVEDSKRSFPNHCPCNTIHSLAFRSEGVRYKARLDVKRRLRGSELALMMGLEDVTVSGIDGEPKRLPAGTLAQMVSWAVRKFCQSADSEIGPQHFKPMAGVDAEGCTENEDALREFLVSVAQDVWLDLSSVEGKFPYTHDCYVKSWQLGGAEIAADYVLLDEAQDVSPVMLDIMAQQVKRGTRVILVGDSAQQIYQWRGAVNALAAFPDAKRLLLSQSFRFGPAIAELANAVLSELKEKSPLKMRGAPWLRSRVGYLERPRAMLCRTNAGAVGHFLSAAAGGLDPFLVGGGDEAIAFVEGARDLQQGSGTTHPDLACFLSWLEVQAYSETDEGEDLKLMVKLTDEFGAQNILDGLRRMPEEKDAGLVVSTAHKSKGREWETVKLAQDFPPMSRSEDEAIRLLYVAGTRAKGIIDVSECAPFRGGRRRFNEGGGEERIIDISLARQISREVEAMPSEVAAEANGAPTPIPAPAPAPISDGPRPTGVPSGNTFSKGKAPGEWLIRGPRGQSGRVEVRLKSGGQAMKEIDRVVWENEEVALYSVKK